jgi:hypothetical protein
LPGCLSFGDSLDEARYNIREDIELYLSTLLEEDKQVPIHEGRDIYKGTLLNIIKQTGLGKKEFLKLIKG